MTRLRAAHGEFVFTSDPETPRRARRAASERSCMARRGHQVGRRKATRTVVPYGGRDGYRVEIPVYRVGGQVVDCESLLEGDFVTIVEAYDRDLVEIQEQPLAPDLLRGPLPHMDAGLPAAPEGEAPGARRGEDA